MSNDSRNVPTHTSQQQASAARRQFLKTTLAVGAPLIVTMASRPAFGWGEPSTVNWSSGISANLASGELGDRPKGRSPGYWKTHPWPMPYASGNKFYDVFQCYFPTNGQYPDPNKKVIVNGSEKRVKNITLGDVMNYNDDLNKWNSAAAYHAVAHLFNAASGMPYPFSVAGVKKIFCRGYGDLNGDWEAITDFFQMFQT